MISVWGANGFIGRHIAHRLSEEGQGARLIARQFDGFPFAPSENIEFIKADFLDLPKAVEPIMHNDTLILLVTASYARTNSDSIEQEILQNVKPYENFLTELSKKSIKLKQIIYASSGGAIYGPVFPHAPIKEETPLLSQSPYGIAKKQIETHIINYAQERSVPFTILRIANPIGIWTSRSSLVTAALKSIKDNTPLTIFGNGTAVRDYFDVEDLAKAFYICSNNSGAHNQIFNIGSGRGHSINDIISEMENVIGRQISKSYNLDYTTDLDFNILDCNKAYKTLNWSSRSPIFQTIEKMWVAT